MAIIVYIDAVNGTDELEGGSQASPLRTLEYFCNTVAKKDNADYEVRLQNGTYEITTSTIFGQFKSGTMDIVGLGEKTEIIQKTGMYMNAIGGSQDFTLNIKRLKYNILTTLTFYNLMGFNWSWNFYNVLFEYTPSNAYSVFSSINTSKGMTIKNCVKLTNTTCFLRKNTSTISVYDSMGYFTSGYETTQSNWDRGGNTIGSIGDYQQVLEGGLYSWVKNKSYINNLLFSSNNALYSLKSIDTIYKIKMTSNTAPAPLVARASINHTNGGASWGAFNGLASGQWMTPDNSGANQWIQIYFGEEKKVNTIQLNARYDNFFYQNPYKFKIQYSNDGVSWSDSEIIESHKFTSKDDVFKYKLKERIKGSYFRLYVTELFAGNNNISIGEIIYGDNYIETYEISNISESNFINYGEKKLENLNSILTSKNYILSQNDSKNQDGLLVTQINRKPLSIGIS